MRLRLFTLAAMAASLLCATLVKGQSITLKPRPLLPGELPGEQTMFDLLINAEQPCKVISLGFEMSSMRGRAALMGAAEGDAALVQTKAKIGVVTFVINQEIPAGITKFTVVLPKHPVWIRVNYTLSAFRKGDEPAQAFTIGIGATYGTPPSKKKP